MKKLFLALAAGAMIAPVPALAALPSPAPASQGQFIQFNAVDYATGNAEQYRDRRDRWDRRDDRRYREGRRDQRLNNNSRVWRGRDGRNYCQRDDGTTGLLIGGAVGGLIGNEIAGRGDKLLGTVLGAAGGALLGREIDRDKYRCR